MKRDNERADNIAAWFLVTIGVFLIADSLFVHAITYDYSIVSLSALDPYIHHWMWGAICVSLGAWSLNSR